MTRSLTARRCQLAVALIFTIAIGLSSRMVHTPLPRQLQKELGDVLWAMAAYWAIALIAPNWPKLKVAALSVVLSWISEASQLSHADVLQTLRAYRVGQLLLGSGFSWLDMAMYPIGAVLALVIDRRASSSWIRG